MENLFKAITDGAKANAIAADLVGRTLGLQLGIVADIEDPMELGRIKVLLPSKGGKTLTDWLLRAMPWYGLSVPRLTLGDTVVVMFVDGNPHQGVYLGVLTNTNNLAYGDQWVYNTPNSQTVISPEGKLTHTVANTSFSVDGQGNVAFTGVTSFTVNGKEITTLGAKDTDNDTLVTKGWT